MAWLDSFRKESKKWFDQLPLEKSQYTSLDLDFESILKNRTVRDAKLLDRVREIIDKNDRLLIVQLNDEIVFSNTGEELQNGLYVRSIKDVLRHDPDSLKKLIEGSEIKPHESKLAAFNYANFDSGVVVSLAENKDFVSKPVHHIIVIDGGSTISQTHISVGKASSLTYVQECYSTEKEAFYNNITSISVADGSAMNFVSMQKFSENVKSVTNQKARLGRDANINWTMCRLGAGIDKSSRDTILGGQGASVEDVEVFFGDGTQHFDITSNINHTVPYTRGNVLVKGVLKDEARSVSQGMIRIDKGAQKTDSFLAEHTLMLDPTARSDAIPGLEIEANDVRATHSASTSQIDKEQIFYLEARGLPEAEAKKLIVLGFLDSALQKIVDRDVSERFKGLVEEKWQASEL